MAESRRTSFRLRWLVIPAVLIILLITFVFVKNTARPKQPEETSSLVSNQLSQEDAITAVNAQVEVKEYLTRVPEGLVAVNGEEEDVYLVQVYEIKNGHTATFNWYRVDKATGTITKEF